MPCATAPEPITLIGFGLTRYNYLSHIGFGALGISYLMTNMVALRCCLVAANVGLISWGVVALEGAAAWSAVCWNALFLIINSWRLAGLLRQRSNVPAGMRMLADPLLPRRARGSGSKTMPAAVCANSSQYVNTRSPIEVSRSPRDFPLQ